MEKFITKYIDKIFWLISPIVLSIFFLGLILNENHGGAKEDLILHTYPAIISFYTNGLVLTLKNYGVFQELTFPLHHIIHGTFNPFVSNLEYFRISTTLISLIAIYLIFIIVKERYQINNKINFLISSIILFSPYFRGSAYFGLHEVTGYLFILSSIYYFNKQVSLSNIFLICIFSSLALYTRNQYVFFPLFFLSFLIFKKKYFFFIISSTIYAILALPGVYLIILWDGLIPKEYGDPLSSLVNIKNVPFGISVFFCNLFLFIFPFFLFFIISQKNFRNQIFYLKKVIIESLFILFIFIIFYQALKFNIFQNGIINGKIFGLGALIKYLNFFIPNLNWIYLIFSSLSLSILLTILETNFKNYLIITIIILIYSTRVHLFTEYFDPLFFLLFLLIIDLKNFNEYFAKKNSIFFSIFLIYYSGILIIKLVTTYL